MNRKEACTLATRAVSIHRSGKQWVVVGPHHDIDPFGPCVEQVVSHYRLAQITAARWRARVALSYLNALNAHTASVIEAATLADTRMLVDRAMIVRHYGAAA